MYQQPEVNDAPTTEPLADIPTASPYYDRLRSLALERDFAPVGSPERQWIDQQISETTQRALDRLKAIDRIAPESLL